MTMPTVTELAEPLEPVTLDPFIDRVAWSPPAAANAQRATGRALAGVARSAVAWEGRS
jgi:hypothetical protein